MRRCRGFHHRHRRRGRPPVFGLVPRPVAKVVYAPRLVEADEYPDAVELCQDEVEAMKLAHVDGLTVEQIAEALGVSASTAWRILESGRRKVAEALSNLKPIKIVPLNEGKA